MKQKKYKLGVALSGGGAKGFAHLGVMQALYERGIYPDVIAGTSAGAFAGVFLADGSMPKDILGFFQNRVFKEFAEFTLPQTGFFKTTRFQSFLKEHLKATRFEDLKTPIRIVATDIAQGKSKVFSSGDLIPAVIASCSVPIVFTPVEIGGCYYLDGGLFKNFPVSAIKDDCETVIGINVSPLTHLEYRHSMKYIAERSFHYMSVSNTFADRKLCDHLIELSNLSHYSMFDLEHIEEIYENGYDLAHSYLDKNKIGTT